MEEGERTFDPGGCEFDRERQTIQPGANLGDGGRVFPVKFKIWLGSDGALHEQRDRRILRQHLNRRHGSRIRQRKRRHRKFMFPVNVQRCATRYQDFKIGTRGQEFRHGRRCLNQVLEIVEQEQHWRAQ